MGDDYRDLVSLPGELRLALLEEGAGPFQTVAGPGEAAGQTVGLPVHFPIGKGTFVGYDPGLIGLAFGAFAQHPGQRLLVSWFQL